MSPIVILELKVDDTKNKCYYKIAFYTRVNNVKERVVLPLNLVLVLGSKGPYVNKAGESTKYLGLPIYLLLFQLTLCIKLFQLPSDFKASTVRGKPRRQYGQLYMFCSSALI